MPKRRKTFLFRKSVTIESIGDMANCPSRIMLSAAFFSRKRERSPPNAGKGQA